VQDAPWPSAVIFDFNGTLSDDEGVLFEVFQELFRDHLDRGLTAAEYFGSLAGLSDREILERALGEQPSDGTLEHLLAERRERYADRVRAKSPVRPAVRRLVEVLAESGRRLAIVTGAQRADVDLVLEGLPEARHFDVILTAEDVSRGKPEPDGFLLAARRLGTPPESTVVLEDSVAGVRAGRSAGMTVVAVTGTARADELAACGAHVVDELGPDLLGRPPFGG
jgi:beta-phosphoglucomutase